MTLFTPRRTSPRLALALPLIIVALTAGAHYLGLWLEARGEQLQRIAEARARASVLDLARELPPADRARVMAAMGREAGKAADQRMVGSALREALKRCGKAADGAACTAALSGLEAWALEAEQPVQLNRALRVGLLALVALAAGVLGWITVRQIPGRLAGFCLMGAALVVAGAGWRVNELFNQSSARQSAARVDVLVARGRLMARLPAGSRARRLQALTGQLAQQPTVTPSSVEGLRGAAKACGATRIACGKVLMALGRIHTNNRSTAPAGRIRRWIDRWLLWSGIVSLLLVALVTAARRGGGGAERKA